MNLQIPPELEAELTRLSAQTRRTAGQGALDPVASSIDQGEWFGAEVERAARPAVKAGCSSMTHDHVAALKAVTTVVS